MKRIIRPVKRKYIEITSKRKKKNLRNLLEKSRGREIRGSRSRTLRELQKIAARIIKEKRIV